MSWDYPMVRAHLKALLERSGVFPPAATLMAQDGTGNAILMSGSWLLGNDPEQPDRRSTPIEIVIHGHVADLFRNANTDMLKQLEEALVRVVARRMKRYRADHGLPYHRAPPPFKIRIDTVGLD